MSPSFLLWRRNFKGYSSSAQSLPLLTLTQSTQTTTTVPQRGDDFVQGNVGLQYMFHGVVR